MPLSSQRFFFPDSLFLIALLSLSSSAAARAQSPTPPATPVSTPDIPPAPSQIAPQSNPNAEISTTDSPTTLKIRVNVVVVRAVVRDVDGHVIDNLKKEDFQLLDNNKPQIISSFAVEHPSIHALPATSAKPSVATSETLNTAEPAVVLPERFVALVFDDIHLKIEDAVFARSAANKVLDGATPADLIAVYTTSGVITQDFTRDLAALRSALLRIVPRPLQGGTNINECPNISYFQAERMITFHDSEAITAADQDAWTCAFNQDPKQYSAAVRLAQTAAQQVQSQGDGETDALFRRLTQFIQRLSGMPGQRILAFISPGLASTEATRQLNEAIDRAVKANVVVDTIDARGLYTPDLGDIAAPPGAVGQSGVSARFHLLEQSMAGEILGSLAAGTGGTWFHNRNDLDAGMRQVIAAPATSYVLSFSPQNLKPDGRYHNLKLKLVLAKGLQVQARHGYFAPKTAPDPASQAQAEIEEALVSQDELNEFPIELKTQFFMKDATNATVTVLAHLDIKSLHFRKAEGRNFNDVVVATAIFDQDGNYITGSEKTLKVKMLDATLAQHSNSGLTIRSTFDLKPGTYLVRMVGRETQGAQMTARNGAVVIPN
jgi:VWFA-related protein